MTIHHVKISEMQDVKDALVSVPMRPLPDGSPALQGSPDCSPILAIHRGLDGYVSFHRKRADQFENLCSVQASELDSMFPSFREELERDSYFSVNSFYRAGRGRNKNLPGLPRAYRKSEGLRYLNACFSDVDLYKRGLELWDGVAGAVYLQETGRIPPASIMARSGRGLWLLWLLKDMNGIFPPRAWPEKQFLWSKIQKVIGERLANLGADAAARDLARILRVPGSLNTVAERRVTYWIQAGQDGKGYVYTLRDLQDFFEIEVHPEIGRAFVKRTGTWGGFAKVFASHLRQFETLRDIRRGFREGERNRSALLYTHLLRRNGVSKSHIVEFVLEMAAECKPPLSEREARQAVESAYSSIKRKHRRGGGFGNDTISNWLRITAGESEQLETWPPASQFSLPVCPSSAERRRAAIRDFVNGSRHVPPLREIKLHLRANKGISASLRTLMKDLAKLNLVKSRHYQMSLLG